MASIISTKTSSGGGIAFTGDTSGVLQLASNNGTTAVTVDASQNVGIGTASPTNKLVLDVNAGTGGLDGYRLQSSGTTRGALFVAGSAYNYSAVGANNLWLYNIANDLVVGSDGAYVTKFITNGAERMRIDTSGNVLVNTTANPDSGKMAIAYTSGVNNGIGMSASATTTQSAIIFRNPNGVVGQITTNGSATSYVTSSDYRLKENIAPMTGALDTVAKLKPVTYNWKADGSDGQGFIAHELQEFVPDCVTGEKDAVDADGNPVYQGIDTSFLVATLTAAIQELNAKVTALEAQLGAK